MFGCTVIKDTLKTLAIPCMKHIAFGQCLRLPWGFIIRHNYGLPQCGVNQASRAWCGRPLSQLLVTMGNPDC